MGWKKDKDDRCTGCGHPRSETFDPEKVQAFDAEPLACHMCAARDRAVKAYRNNKGEEAGVFWRTFEKEGVDHG